MYANTVTFDRMFIFTVKCFNIKVCVIADILFAHVLMQKLVIKFPFPYF